METLQSSVTILGVETFSPEIDAAVRTTVADALEVDESQVMIVSAQSVESDGRRLVGGLHVTFEVIFDSEEASADVSEDSQALPSEVAEQTSNASIPQNREPLDADSSDGGRGSSQGTSSRGKRVSSAFANLKQLSENKKDFQERLTATLKEQGMAEPPALQVEMAPPTLQSVMVRRIAAQWSPCQNESLQNLDRDPCIDYPGYQSRDVSCVSDDNSSKQMLEAFCQGLPVLTAERPCTYSARSATECNTSLGSEKSLLEESSSTDTGLLKPLEMVLSIVALSTICVSMCFAIYCFRRRSARRRNVSHKIAQAQPAPVFSGAACMSMHEVHVPEHATPRLEPVAPVEPILPAPDEMAHEELIPVGNTNELTSRLRDSRVLEINLDDEFPDIIAIERRQVERRQQVLNDGRSMFAHQAIERRQVNV